MVLLTILGIFFCLELLEHAIGLLRCRCRPIFASAATIEFLNFKNQNALKLSEKIKSEGKWNFDGGSNRIWEEMADCIRRSAREVLRVSREGSRRMKGAWWWSEEMKGKVKAKQEKFKALMDSRTDEELESNKVQYKTAKKGGKESCGSSKEQCLRVVISET